MAFLKTRTEVVLLRSHLQEGEETEMGTQTIYRLFAGVTSDLFADLESPFLDKVLKADDSVEEGGLKFTCFYFDERLQAIGVQVQELDWETEVNETNEYDPGIAERAQQILVKVNAIFQELELPLTAKLYHYIDLE